MMRIGMWLCRAWRRLTGRRTLLLLRWGEELLFLETDSRTLIFGGLGNGLLGFGIG